MVQLPAGDSALQGQGYWRGLPKENAALERGRCDGKGFATTPQRQGGCADSTPGPAVRESCGGRDGQAIRQECPHSGG